MSYVASKMPEIKDLEELRRYVEQEFYAVERAEQEDTVLELRPIFKEPVRPREGMIVFADGTEWNPGGGKGVYVRSGTSWVKL